MVDLIQRVLSHVKRNVTIPEGAAVVIGTPQTPDPRRCHRRSISSPDLGFPTS
jgi:hypothetical protein